MREAVQTLPVSLTPDATDAVREAMGVFFFGNGYAEANAAIFAAAYAARDAHPKWELFTIHVEGVTLQMRRKDRPSARLLVTTD